MIGSGIVSSIQATERIERLARTAPKSIAMVTWVNALGDTLEVKFDHSERCANNDIKVNMVLGNETRLKLVNEIIQRARAVPRPVATVPKL